MRGEPLELLRRLLPEGLPALLPWPELAPSFANMLGLGMKMELWRLLVLGKSRGPAGNGEAYREVRLEVALLAPKPRRPTVKLVEGDTGTWCEFPESRELGRAGTWFIERFETADLLEFLEFDRSGTILAESLRRTAAAPFLPKRCQCLSSFSRLDR
jgi:hypothetical protein